MAAQLAQSYFRQHGIASSINIGRLGFSGIAGSIALGPADAPDFSAEAMELDFDPLSWKPVITQVRLINPVVRARVDAAGHVTVPGLEQWLDSLSGGGRSSYVSDDLVIVFSRLRALLATPAGALELQGAAKIRRSQLVSAAITARPATVAYQGNTIRISAADVKLNSVAGGYALAAHFEGALKNSAIEATDIKAQLSTPVFRWHAETKSFSVPSLKLQIGAASLDSGGIKATAPRLDLTADAVHGSVNKGLADAGADLHVTAGADFAPPALAAKFSLLAKEPRLAKTLEDNLRHLDIALAANVSRQDGVFRFLLAQPLQIHGAGGGFLSLTRLGVHGLPSSLQGFFDAALAGPGLPRLSLHSTNFQWQGGGFKSDAVLAGHFDFAMLRGADVKLGGRASFQNGTFVFALNGCAPATLAAFHTASGDMAQNVKGSVCAAPGEQTFSAAASGWKFAALGRGVAFAVPLAQAGVSDGAGHILFSGSGDAVSGKIAVTAAKLADRLTARRFEPVSATGDVSLDNWIWQGNFAVADTKGDALGTVRFHDALASGEGQMTIAAPHLEFAQGKLQPALLSPLLGSVSQVKGAAHFDGVIDWSPAGYQSHGTLGMDELDVLTPLGTAHAVNANIAFRSLLPPITAPGQHITISQIDWPLPPSAIALDFSFGAGTLNVESLSGTISDGKVRLGAFNIDLNGTPAVKGAAAITGISLEPLVAASNLGGKVKLEGHVTGSVPFSFGPDGFRIANGHLASTGPGHISLDRSIWNEGATVSVNAVQDLAYQALENLAFDSLTADINSVANGRLQIIFHIKGRSDPPKPQQAEVALSDILNGSALQKPIQLTSGTPIDLTLDTSLNFDELLKSYAEAWSKALAQAGQSN